MTGQVIRGHLISASGDVADGVIAISGGLIEYAGHADGWHGNLPTRTPGFITPGLIDLHCHGGGGHYVGDGAHGAQQVADHHLRRGTTTMLGSLVSAPPDVTAASIAAIASIARSSGVSSEATSTLIGSHLEGPFLGAGHCGAHDPSALRAPDTSVVEDWLAAAGGTLRMMTLAPELPGAAEVADVLLAHGAIAAAGHTDADVATFSAALSSGFSVITHLYNGMAPMHHREPGPVAASLGALLAGEVYAELIADGVHVADEILALMFQLAPDRLVLVSDAMAAAGMPDGAYQLGSLEVDVRDGQVWTRGDAPSLAGSTAHLADCVRHCIVDAGIPAAAIIAAATSTPARLLGLADRGVIAAGARADLVVFDEGWNVSQVLRDGAWVG